MSEWKKGGPVLSTGQPSTLGMYRKLTVAFFGEDSKAVKYLDKKIVEQGKNETVLADERQLLQALWHMHQGGGTA